MHKFLRAIGFSGIRTREQLEALLKEVEQNPSKTFFSSYEDDVCLGEYSKEFCPGMGISLCGEVDVLERFSGDYYFPFFRGRHVSTKESSIIERHAAQVSFAGVCDDPKVGISIIYYLINRADYLSEAAKNKDLKAVKEGREPRQTASLSLSALALNGTIMMPLAKNVRQKTKAEVSDRKRNKLLEAARNGDENAIESLTLEDLDIYSTILRKIKHTDVYSLVDTYFMPYGVECDQYSVLGEITELSEVTNPVSGEQVYVMSIICNEIPMDLCINKGDLYGEPQVGRRFKGTVWLQGQLNYPEK